MDICKNKIDLMYLTNSVYQNKSKAKHEKSLIKEDINFYKKRIFQLTKDILRNKSVNNRVEDAFNNYALTAIKCFKFQDKMEIYQKQYNNVTEKVKKPKEDFEIMTMNKMMCKEIKITQKSVKELMKVQTNVKKQQMFIPKKKEIVIDTNEYKMKGVKEKSK
tara:strand:+ start:1594 stop:2079 length:486 start_codon:yes stop_codon:yes gene_type:complete